MKSRIILLSFLLIGSSTFIAAQTLLYSENFGTGTTFPTGWSPQATGNWVVNSTNPSSGYTGASGGSNLASGSSNTSKYVTYDGSLSTIGYNNITVLWGARRNSSKSCTFEWSSNGTTWNAVTFTEVSNNSTWALVNGGSRISLPSGAAGIANLRFRWTFDSDGNTGAYRIDDFSVQGSLPQAYRSKASGNWGSTGSWEVYSGSSWVAATATPTSTDADITIQSGHVITVAANVTIDQTTINSGGQVTVNSGITLTVANGTETTDLTVNGTLSNSGTINTTGAIGVEADGTYNHEINGGTIPTASWNSTSTCTIKGVTSATSISGIGQSFGNLTWNSTSQTSVLYLQSNLSIAGNFVVQSTGTGDLRLSNTSTGYTVTVGSDYSQTSGNFKLNNSSGGCTMDIAGDFSLSSGTFCIVTGTANSTVNVTGNASISGGTLLMSEDANIGTLNVSGNLSFTSGTISETSTGSGAIKFAGTTTQTFTSGGTLSGVINFTVNSNAVVDFGTSIISSGSTGTFTLSSAATIITAHLQGISTSGATGSVQVTGTRTYNSAANITYTGSAAQITGNALVTANTVIINTSSPSVTVTSSAPFTATNLIVNQGVLQLTGTSANYNITNDLTIQSNGTLSHQVNWDTHGKLLSIGGNISISGIYDHTGVARSHVQMVGSGIKYISTGSSSLNIFTLNNTGGDFRANGPITIDDNFWASMDIAGGAFRTNGQNVTANSSLLNAGGTVYVDGGSLTINGGLKVGENTQNGAVIISSGVLNTDFISLGNGTRTGTITQSGGTVNISNYMLIYASCTYTCSNSPSINIAGNWTNNGAFTKATGTVAFNGISTQTIGGSNSTNFYNLTISNPAGITLGRSTTVDNTVTFIDGIINATANTLILSASATAISGAGSNKYVNGNLQINIPVGTSSRVFEIGDASNYTPVIISFAGTATNGSGNISAKSVAGDHPQVATSGLNQNMSVNRYFVLANSGVTFGTYDATFTFINPTDLDAGANPSNFIVKRYFSSSWSSTNIGNRTSSSTQITGANQSQFGEFQIGEIPCTSPVAFNVTGGGSYCSGGSGLEVGLDGSETGVNYQLKLDGSATGSIVPGTGSSLSFGLMVTAGTYSVTATRVLGGCSNDMDGSVTIIINPVPSAPTTGNNGPVCAGTALMLTASTITGASYNWTGPNGYSSSEQNPTVSGSATTAMAGTYNVTATVAGCPSPQSSTTVTINSVNAPVATAATDITSGGFTANWNSVSGALYYKLDVSASGDFSSMLPGYNDRNVGNVLTFAVSTLNPNTPYFYRVRVYDGTCTSLNSNVISLITIPPADQYRSNTTGVWNNLANWEVSSDGGSNWLPATHFPDYNDGSITIKSGHTITITNDLRVDEVIVEAGGILINNMCPDGFFTLNDGSGTDLQVFGTLTSKDDIDNYGTIVFNSGSLYQHIRSFGKKSTSDFSEIPVAGWDLNSTCEILSVFATPYAGLDQAFGNFTWNFANQTGEINLEGLLTTINGNLTISNTGSSALELTSSQNSTITVGGNLLVTGGILELCSGPGNTTLNIAGNGTIGGTGSLRVSAGSNLTINGSLVNTAGNNGLVIKSNSNRSGSLLHFSSNVSAKVERYISNDLKWHFLASPVSNQEIWPGFAPAPAGSPLSFGSQPWNWDFFYWNPNADISSTLYWVNLRKFNGDYNSAAIDQAGSYAGFGNVNPAAFENSRGYLVAYNTGWNPATGSPETHLFNGSLNAGSISRTVLQGANTYNLVGNPFASSIDWKAASGWDRNALKLNGTSQGYDYWLWNDAVANYGAFNSADPDGTGTNGVDRYIAPTQAFFVQAADDGSFSMDNSVRVHSNQNWLKEAQYLPGFIKLNLSSTLNSYSDETIISFDASYSGGGTDKWWSMYDESPEIYTEKEGYYYTINRYNSLDQDVIVNVNTKIGISGEYTISAPAISEFILSSKVILEDLKTGSLTNLKQKNNYNFTADPADNRNRFRLIIGSPIGMGEPAEDHFLIYAVDQSVYIQNEKPDRTYQVSVSNMVGQIVGKKELSGSGLNRLDLELKPGIYIVSILTNGEIRSQKIVIR